MSGKYNAKFLELKFIKNQSKSKKYKFFEKRGWQVMSLGGWKDGLKVGIIWVLVKIDNGIIGDFKIGVEMVKWRWEFGDENRKNWSGIMRGNDEMTMTYLINVIAADKFLKESLKAVGPILRTMSCHQGFRKKFISQWFWKIII